MKLPNNINLPFFAYGIFKPGQLCYPRIADLVKEYSFSSISGSLKERDGVPLLLLNNISKINGALINFSDGQENQAYQRIADIEPEEVYTWKEAKIDNITANVLVGRRTDRGSFEIEHLNNWDGKNDPLFKQAIEEIDLILKVNSEFDWEYRSLFRLQMGYTLLWTAIERYAGLKYHLGNRATEKIYNIAEEKSFIKSLKKNVKDIRYIYSTTDLEKYTLDPDNPQKSIRYYYQVRSNAIHRGKVVTRDFDIIRSSLTELLAIFRDTLNEAFEDIDAYQLFSRKIDDKKNNNH